MFKGIVTDIFFDLDHTLWDFEKNSRLTFQKIFREQNIPVDLDRFLKVYAPINFEYWKLYREERVTKAELRYERLRKSMDTIGFAIADHQINALSQSYIANLSTFNNVIPGARDVLDYLNPKYRLHIITNGFEEVQEKKLRNANIREYFHVVVNSEMAGVKKPHPQIFQMALQKANIEAPRSLMIGDSLEADVLGALKVGLHAIHFNTNGEAAHDHSKIIHRLDEIKHFL